MIPANKKRILLTGATGYVGGRLLSMLESRPYEIRCLVRNPENLRSRTATTTRVFQGDVLDKASLATALEGVQVAFYLVHAMGAESRFEEKELDGVRNFAEAARAAGVERIIYLGGLGSDSDSLSAHLRSRHTVGEVLRNSGVPTIEFRASIIIGSGSLSFEMIRALTERLPIMVTPRWVSALAQPLAIQDTLRYLTAAIEVPLTESVVVEIGGPDRLSYRDLIAEYACQRGLKRYMISVPVLTPRLSSLWLALVTPLYARIGRKLIDSMRHSTVVTSDVAERMFDLRPIGASEAIRSALRHEDQEYTETSWYDSVSAAGAASSKVAPHYGNRLVDHREIYVEAAPEIAFHVIAGLGGRNGWLIYNWLWRLRGAIDLLIGGVGMRRGRPMNRNLRVGDAVDFWRVESFEPPLKLRLRAEMRLPGRAWLEFAVEQQGSGCVVHQTAEFDPLGVSGLLYWYGIYTLHMMVFKGMLRAIAKSIVAKSRAAGQKASPASAK